MRERVRKFVRSCEVCQKSKFPVRKLVGTLNPILAEYPGQLVTVDYYGPLPEGRGKVAYVFVVIDSFSKFVRLYPLRRAQAKISATKMIEDYCKFMKVETVLSDHGTQFTSKTWQDLLKRNCIKPTLSSIRHPASNPTERVMKELSRLFRTYTHHSHRGWPNHLGNIETLFNNTPHISTGYTPNEILFGKGAHNPLKNALLSLLPPSVPKDVETIRQEVRENLRVKAMTRAKHARTFHDQLTIGDFVLLRENPISDADHKMIAKFCPLFSGPFKVTAIPFPNVYSLADPVTGIAKGNYNITNLKLFHKNNSKIK